jgi:hypothetical protein
MNEIIALGGTKSMKNHTRRSFFATLAGIVAGGAGAAVAGPNLRLQNEPIPAIQAVNEGIRMNKSSRSFGWTGYVVTGHGREV